MWGRQGADRKSEKCHSHATYVGASWSLSGGLIPASHSQARLSRALKPAQPSQAKPIKPSQVAPESRLGLIESLGVRDCKSNHRCIILYHYCRAWSLSAMVSVPNPSPYKVLLSLNSPCFSRRYILPQHHPFHNHQAHPSLKQNCHPRALYANAKLSPLQPYVL
jgi:hypothetical protein